MIVESIHQWVISILNVYVPNIRASKQRKRQIEFQEEIDKSTILIGDFNTLPSIDRVDRKISKNIQDLNNTINKLEFINIYRKLNSRIHI